MFIFDIFKKAVGKERDYRKELMPKVDFVKDIVETNLIPLLKVAQCNEEMSFQSLEKKVFDYICYFNSNRFIKLNAEGTWTATIKYGDKEVISFNVEFSNDPEHILNLDADNLLEKIIDNLPNEEKKKCRFIQYKNNFQKGIDVDSKITFCS